MIYHDSIILGAGASGLMAAYKYKHRDIALIDANRAVGQKIKISGGGKCNITNVTVTPEHFYGDSLFIKKVLDNFSRDALLRFFKSHGVDIILRKKRYYFCKHSSQEVIEALKCDTTRYLSQTVMKVTKEKDFIIQTDKKQYACKNLIVATGGLSYPKIGASGIAFEIAKTFGHDIVPLKPALVGFTVQKEQFWFKELSGLSIPVVMKVGEKNFQDDLLFTHKGLSGPAVLNVSLYWDKGPIKIDFLPAISKERLRTLPKKALALPKRFLSAFLSRYPIEMLKSYQFSPAGNFGYTKAEVTRGGVATEEIEAESMMSKKEKNLFFIGEALNVTGELGGYNFQWAFASAQNLKLGR